VQQVTYSACRIARICNYYLREQAYAADHTGGVPQVIYLVDQRESQDGALQGQCLEALRADFPQPSRTESLRRVR
jgi:hypothetical protein